MSFLPSMPNALLLDVFRAYTELAAPLHDFAEVLMRGPSPFSPGERELIAAYVSSLNACDYCRSSHTAVAERFGVPAGVVDELVKNIDAAPVPDRLKPVLHYVRKLNYVPDQVSRADADAVYAAGWDETALCHAVLVCAHFNLMNRWVDGLGIEADPAMIRMAGEHLHKKGYRGVLQALGKRQQPTPHPSRRTS